MIYEINVNTDKKQCHKCKKYGKGFYQANAGKVSRYAQIENKYICPKCVINRLNMEAKNLEKVID